MKHLTYVACYTDEKKEGIYILESDDETGAFYLLDAVRGIENSTCLTINHKKTVLYAGQGLPEYGPKAINGAVAAYGIKGDKLVPLNHRRLGVTPPCYVSLDPAEQALAFAEYTNAMAGVFELAPDGSFAATPPVTVKHVGKGPDPERQTHAHAHCAEFSPDGLHLCVVDLGIDRVKVYDFPGRANGLQERSGMTITSAGGAGPRHILFHPNRQTAYLLHELNNTISSFVYTGDAFKHIQTLNMLPAGFKDFSKAAALKFSPDG